MSVLRLVDAAIAPASTTTPLLSHIDLSIGARERCAVIGPNGSGKSTLLAALAGRLPVLAGTLHRARGASVAFADRGVRPPGHTVELELLSHRAADAAALARLRALERTAGNPVALAAAIDAWDERSGWELEARLARMLVGAGLADVGPGRLLRELSGGQRQRVELAALLLAEADVVLLDEPTDDLDEDAVAWFERELLGLDAAVVIASHDRTLLDRWPTRIALVDPHAGRVRTGAGPLAAFEQVEAQREAAAERDHAASERRSAAAERAAAARAAKAMTMHRVDLNDGRHSKQEKAWYNERAGGLARSARVLRERDERARVERPHRPRTIGRVSVASLDGGAPSGGTLLDATGLVVGHGDVPVCGPLDLVAERGERVALVGPNGAGKTTLLRTLAGALPCLGGSMRLGGTVFATLEQQVPGELLDHTALEVIAARVAPEQRAAASTTLGALLVRGRDLQRPVRELSEGSRRKVLLAALLASGADLLLLDEPANHLDLPARDALAEALASSTAAMVFTSHDRHLRALVATRVVELG